jgi:hypothetical protein
VAGPAGCGTDHFWASPTPGKGSLVVVGLILLLVQGLGVDAIGAALS